MLRALRNNVIGVPEPTSMLPRERLKGIPDELIPLHEISFFFHDQAVQCLKEFDQHPELRSFEVKLRERPLPDELAQMNGIDLARFAGYHDEAKSLMLNECVMALIADGLHFICEALFAYEKGKLAVSLSLMRKPLKENLLYLEWIIADPDDFYAAFADPERRSLLVDVLSPERKREIIDDAMAKTGLATLRDSKLLYDLRYEKKANGLEPLWQKAMHLVTTMNSHIRTEEENFNFIFANEEQRAGIYAHIALPYMLLCIHFHDMAITAARRIAPLHEGTIRYHEICKFAAYTVVSADWQEFGATFRDAIAIINEHVSCDCGARADFTAQDFGGALFSRKFVCKTCKDEGDFDLFYLMGFDKQPL